MDNPVAMNLRIDWSEIDLFGHVNNVAYFKYIQAARVNFWERCGHSAMFNESDIGPILLSTGCQFRIPLFYPGQIRIETRLEFMKTTSYGLHHKIFNESDEMAAEAHDVIVNYDFKRKEKTPISESFRARMNVIN